MMSSRRKILLLIVLLIGFTFINGCASRSVPVTKPSAQAPPVAKPSPAPAREQAPLPAPQPAISNRSTTVLPKVQTTPSKPVATLIAKAESEFSAGHFDRSAANIERAIRIEPRNPMLWHRLAAIHLQQGNYAQAESMASKSNSLIVPGAALARKNWQIIAEARRLMGDIKGAQKALNHAR